MSIDPNLSPMINRIGSLNSSGYSVNQTLPVLHYDNTGSEDDLNINIIYLRSDKLADTIWEEGWCLLSTNYNLI